ncbi:MAG: DUF1295 domain-containing protein [Lachnospiraceae bacterium]|nr:MAG: DUF1295 domain-containing protein [Lachnospiraceae bacterium]
MKTFFILLVIALAASACGFKKYVWFISLGYGFAIAAVGAGSLIIFHGNLTTGAVIQCALLIIYGIRLSGYLVYRDVKTAYNRRMKGEVKTNDEVSFGVKFAIWISVALLYVFQTSPAWFRLMDNRGTDAFCVAGVIISAFGIIFEATADLQKNSAKKKNPGQFVSSGLFSFVRCPNYLGEMINWTGVFISGLSIYHNATEWICAVIGYVGIIYVMFSGARRLEIRQDKNYGSDPNYQHYKSTTPIMVPFIPLYSVKKHKWLVA